MKKDLLYRALRIALVFPLCALAVACGENNPDNPEPEPGPDPTPGDSKSIVKLPEGSPFTYNNLVLLGDGAISSLSNDGEFASGLNNVVVLTESNQLVYLSYGCMEDVIIVDANETAISLLLPQIPLAVTDLDDDTLWVLKQMIGHLSTTKELAASIQSSIVDLGYMDMERISPQLKAAVEDIKAHLGIDSSKMGKSNRFRSPSYPYFTNSSSNKTTGDGFTITIKESNLEEKEDGTKYWKCTVDLLNADRFCYTALTKGFKAPNGFYNRLDDSISDTFKTIIKPMNLSAFMDFGTLSDLATDPKDFIKTLSDPDFDRVINYIWEPLKNLGHVIKGEETETVTYDKIKVSDIEMCFYNTNEHMMVIGPGLDGNLLMFNILKIVFQPVLKLVMGEVKKTDEYKNDKDWMDRFLVGFVEWMAKADLTFRAKLLATFTDSNLSWSERLEVVPMLGDRIEEFVLEEGLKYMSKKTFDALFSMGPKKGFDDPSIKAIFLTYKSLLKAGDILQFMLDHDYRGIAFDMTLGQFNEVGGLEDVPGSDL